MIIDEKPRMRGGLARKMIDSATDGISVIGTDFKFVAANKAILNMLGKTEDQVLGHACYEVAFQRARPCSEFGDPCPMAEVLSSGRPSVVEKVLSREGHLPRYLEVSASPIREEDEPFTHIVYVTRDVTEHRRMVRALRQRDAIFRLMVQHDSDMFTILKEDGTILYQSPSVENILGYREDEVVGHTAFDFIHEDDRQRVIRTFTTLLKEPGLIGEGEYRVKRKDGSWRVLSARVHNCLNVPGLNAIVADARDVTIQKQEQKKLAEERQRLELLCDIAPVGIIMVEGREVRQVMLNREMRRMLGLSANADEILYKYGTQSLLEGFSDPAADPPDKPETRFGMMEFNTNPGDVSRKVTFCKPDGSPYSWKERPLGRALLRGETVIAEEMVWKYDDGRSILVLGNVVPILSPSGEVEGAVGIAQDLTPVEESQRLRNEFLGMVSHELKTPLAAIKGTAAMVLGSQHYSGSAETIELFRIINQQADRLNDLINSLLDMTRIEAGMLSVNPEPTDLNQVLGDAIEVFKRSQTTQVNLRLADNVPSARADRRRIFQVITNLLTNAAKFSPAGAPVFVDVNFDESFVTVRVRDQGCGIPTDKMVHLFKKFSQIHGDRGRNLSGTGLGLAITRGIVEAHGGRIWAESEGEGRGSTFSFTLPAVRTPASPTTPATIALRAQHQGKVTRTREKTLILALDDDLNMLRLLKRSLEYAGYEVVLSSDPREAMKLLQAREPDLLLLDLILPATSGFNVLERVREFSGIPVIFISASDDGENIVRALKTGADDYITKPFSPSELLARIETTLRRRVASDTVEVRPPLAVGDLVIDFAERSVTKGSGKVPLSATEYKILYQLAINAGRMLTHKQILHQVWGPQYGGETELVRSMVRNLRRKLGDDARHPTYILTEPQVGYCLRKP